MAEQPFSFPGRGKGRAGYPGGGARNTARQPSEPDRGGRGASLTAANALRPFRALPTFRPLLPGQLSSLREGSGLSTLRSFCNAPRIWVFTVPTGAPRIAAL